MALARRIGGRPAALVTGLYLALRPALPRPSSRSTAWASTWTCSRWAASPWPCSRACCDGGAQGAAARGELPRRWAPAGAAFWQQPVALSYAAAALAVLALRRATWRDPVGAARPGSRWARCPCCSGTLQNGWASGDIMGRDPGELRAQADALPRLPGSAAGSMTFMDTHGCRAEAGPPTDPHDPQRPHDGGRPGHSAGAPPMPGPGRRDGASALFFCAGVTSTDRPRPRSAAQARPRVVDPRVAHPAFRADFKEQGHTSHVTAKRGAGRAPRFHALKGSPNGRAPLGGELRTIRSAAGAFPSSPAAKHRPLPAPAPPSVERLPATVARLEVVPEADLVLAELPAEVDLAALADRREVDQAAVDVADRRCPSSWSSPSSRRTCEEGLADLRARARRRRCRAPPRRAARAPRRR